MHEVVAGRISLSINEFWNVKFYNICNSLFGWRVCFLSSVLLNDGIRRLRAEMNIFQLPVTKSHKSIWFAKVATQRIVSFKLFYSHKVRDEHWSGQRVDSGRTLTANRLPSMRGQEIRFKEWRLAETAERREDINLLFHHLEKAEGRWHIEFCQSIVLSETRKLNTVSAFYIYTCFKSNYTIHWSL